MSAYVPLPLHGLPTEVVVLIMVLWAIAYLFGIYVTKREGVNKITVRAGVLGLTPQGGPVRERYRLGPFDYRDQNQKIWSLNVIRNGKPAVLWIRYNTTDEEAFVVEADGNKVQM